eukprot:1978122-Amphidinium_carterae.2
MASVETKPSLANTDAYGRFCPWFGSHTSRRCVLLGARNIAGLPPQRLVSRWLCNCFESEAWLLVQWPFRLDRKRLFSRKKP